jgi:hypothetical protein
LKFFLLGNSKARRGPGVCTLQESPLSCLCDEQLPWWDGPRRATHDDAARECAFDNGVLPLVSLSCRTRTRTCTHSHPHSQGRFDTAELTFLATNFGWVGHARWPGTLARFLLAGGPSRGLGPRLFIDAYYHISKHPHRHPPTPPAPAPHTQPLKLLFLSFANSLLCGSSRPVETTRTPRVCSREMTHGFTSCTATCATFLCARVRRHDVGLCGAPRRSV